MRYRKHNRNTAFSLLYRRIANINKLKYKARTGRLDGRMLDSGFYADQTYGALAKAWVGFMISKQNGDDDRMRYYAAVIQKLQKEMKGLDYRFKISSFPELQMMAAEFYDDHAEELEADWDKDLTADQIFEIMTRSDSDFWRKVRSEE